MTDQQRFQKLMNLLSPTSNTYTPPPIKSLNDLCWNTRDREFVRKPAEFYNHSNEQWQKATSCEMFHDLVTVTEKLWHSKPKEKRCIMTGAPDGISQYMYCQKIHL